MIQINSYKRLIRNVRETTITKKLDGNFYVLKNQNSSFTKTFVEKINIGHLTTNENFRTQ